MRVWRYLAVLFVLFAFCSPLHAQMREVDDEVLAEITGEGFASFTMEGGVARADFDITTSCEVHIDELKMGYWDNGSGLGWDQDWEDVDFGYSLYPVTCDGLFIEASFSNITDPANRQLEYVRVGTPSMDGRIRADFRSFTGTIDGTMRTRESYRPSLIGIKYSIRPNNDYFYVELNRTSGWSFNFGPNSEILR